MKKNNLLLRQKSGRTFRSGIFIFLILFLQAITLNSAAQGYQQQLTARSNYTHSHSDTLKKWLNWNILFSEKADDLYKDKVIQDLENSIDKKIAQHNASTGQHFKVNYHVVHCPCDPRLTNFNATIGASGSTIPPPPPKPGGSGDTVSLNYPMEPDARPEGNYQVFLKKVALTNSGIDPSKVLAFMDTGLDPNLFEPGFTDLIWKDPGSNPTLRNFQFYHNSQPLDYMLDDDAHVHGTAVTTIALQEFEKATANTKPKPRIMILKVLDERAQGSIFSVSCALSYAFQKQATLVNASLGYYSRGKTDPILLHYVRQCVEANPSSIPILAAAGNIRGTHNPTSLCNLGNNGNELTAINTFDPASFSKRLPNVISVTTLQNLTVPCFFQNYSNEYVNVGVVNGSGAGCCKFRVPFLTFGYEGTSFATPFISGNIMGCLIEGGTLQHCRDQWNTAPVGSVPVTKGGKYVLNR